MKKNILIIIFLLFGIKFLFGNNPLDSIKKTSWYNLGIGFYIKDKVVGESFMVGYTYKINKIIFSPRIIGHFETFWFDHDSIEPHEKNIEIGMTIGYAVLDNPVFKISAISGLGLLGGKVRKDYLNMNGVGIWAKKNYSTEFYITPSIPIQFNFEWQITKSFGIGLYYCLDLNFKKRLFTMGYIFRIGKKQRK